MTAKSDLFYLRMAVEIAQTQSDDLHTQNGAVLVTTRGDIVGAANSFPDGVISSNKRRERPIKYSYIEHAERGVIYNAARINMPTRGATLYCPWFACADCARAIICAGITHVIGLANLPTHAAWQESCNRGDEMLREAGVTYRRLDVKLGLFVLRDGQQIEV
jgi:dCMP deaminase